jgi:aminopeptidase N
VFDQPSLKAKMTLTVTCPQGWKTVSNSLEKRYENAKKEGKRVLERHEIEHFLKFYENENEIALYEFE